MITIEDLRAAKACRPELELFERLYPDGIEPSLEAAQEASDAGLDVLWWISRNHCEWLTGELTCSAGVKRVYLNGLYHCADGPALTYPDGRKEFWKYGQLHCEDGPAVVVPPNGYRAFFLNGTRLSEEEWQTRINTSNKL